MERTKTARNVAIVLVIALAVYLLPGGGRVADTFQALLYIGFGVGFGYLGLQLYREHRVAVYGLGDRHRALLYARARAGDVRDRRARTDVADGHRRALVVRARRRRAVRVSRRIPPLARLLTANRRESAPRILDQMASEQASNGREDASASLAAQRRALPDQPGVYLFRDARDRVIYVGKAKSVRKRVASHFATARVPSSPGHAEMIASVEHVECVVVASEAEALLAEQNFIKQYRPRFNIRLRDDKSYPFIAISLDEEFPRVYFTRERHRPGRAYFGPYSNAKRVRSTLDVLSKVFMFRSCTGAEPGRRSGSPCLDYYIKRCEAPCVGYVSKRDYRRGIDGVIDFLSGRFATIERDLQARMREAAAAEEFEQATLERNRLTAVRALLERGRVAGEAAGTFDAVAVAVDGVDANAQVFQVRDGVLADRQSFYLSNVTERDVGEVAEEFILQYYGGHMSIPAVLVVQSELAQRQAPGSEPAGAGRARAGAGASQGRAGRDPPRRARHQAAHPRPRAAQRAAGARPGAPARRAPSPEQGGRARGPAVSAGPGRAARAHRVL